MYTEKKHLQPNSKKKIYRTFSLFLSEQKDNGHTREFVVVS